MNDPGDSNKSEQYGQGAEHRNRLKINMEMSASASGVVGVAQQQQHIDEIAEWFGAGGDLFFFYFRRYFQQSNRDWCNWLGMT